jgi:CRISPR-associated protein Csd1
MILHALKEYYDRKAEEGTIARDGWIKGGIDFLIEINTMGDPVNLIDLREPDGKKLVSKYFELPNIGKQALKHSNSGKDANLLWDNSSFVFGLGEKGDLRLKSMMDAIDSWFRKDADVGIRAVRMFLEKGLSNRNHFESLLQHPDYADDLQSGNPKLSFKVHGTEYQVVFHSPVVKEALETSNDLELENTKMGTCLVSGATNVPIEATHMVTKGVWGAQTSGACIVSFNKDAFNSYGKKQSLNAPVGKAVASQYGKALNALLENPRQCMHIGDASIVFWAHKKSSFETDFSSFFLEPEKDNPDAGTEKVRTLLNSVSQGTYLEEEGKHTFYILGLAPNAARISIRFWEVGSIFEFATRIRQYFNDFEIVKPPSEPEFYSVWRILVNIAVQDKNDNIPPNLGGDFIRAIMEGKPYPASLLQATLRRIRSDTEQRVKPVRAAIIKAYLNRYYRFYRNPMYKEVGMKLDINQTSSGYQLGRLFAVLEKIQEEASPGINTTIRERFYASACATPVTVFANLLRLKNHHLAKIENKGRVITLERLLGEIMSHVHGFPAHLNLHEQGLFACGYYHQRQDLFTKKSES